MSSSTNNWLTLTENPTQLNALVVQQSNEEEAAAAEAAAKLTTCKCGKIPTKYAENKTLLNFYYLSTTLCTDTENETRKRNENETETKNEAHRRSRRKKISEKKTTSDPIRSGQHITIMRQHCIKRDSDSDSD